MSSSPSPRAFSLPDLLATLVALTLLLAVVLPSLAGARDDANVQTSLSNLNVLAFAHATYAADHDGRQFTNVADDLAAYGNTISSAMSWYRSYHGDHPPILLGWNGGGLWGYWMHRPGSENLVQPIAFAGSAGIRFGIFRIPNAKPFHDYVDGKYYSPYFYAPNDVEPYALVETVFDSPHEFDLFEGTCDAYWSSYCLSPAALYHPDVMRHPDQGGWQYPFDLDHAFTAPNLNAATYPNLKTLMLEHHWNQNAPAQRCNPAFGGGTYDGCEPYYFNHSLASEPAALFYDGSTRLLPNLEVRAAENWLIQQTGHGLWSQDTPFGTDGYFLEFGHGPTGLSHHVLTTDGIHGRDTIHLPPGRVKKPRHFTSSSALDHTN